ncbi:MAG: PIN domain-containing protein [Chloroflexota bacterium]|nr:PIN domain-containing protein [Chloroflexota bacterium]
MNHEQIFLDTAGLMAVLDSDDRFHQPASEIWVHWNTHAALLRTSNYVILEASALVQRRLGMQALQLLHESLLAPVDIIWISQSLHRRALGNLWVANRRYLSLVDCTSFALMRELGLRHVFTFDKHFAEQGFTCLPQ